MAIVFPGAFIIKGGIVMFNRRRMLFGSDGRRQKNMILNVLVLNISPKTRVGARPTHTQTIQQ